MWLIFAVLLPLTTLVDSELQVGLPSDSVTSSEAEAEKLNKQKLEEIGKKYHDSLNSVISKDVEQTLSSLAEVATTLDGIGVPASQIFASAAKESLKTLGPDYEAATLYATQMTATRLSTISTRISALHKNIKKYWLTTDYYESIYKPLHLMTQAQRNYYQDKDYENFKQQCDIYKPDEVLTEMNLILNQICEVPYRIRTKHIRNVKEFFTSLEKSVKVKPELQKQWATLKSDALDKAANDKRANFEWFKNARKSIEMAKSKSGSYDAEQIINTFIGAMPALRSGKFWGVLQILTRTKKLLCF